VIAVCLLAHGVIPRVAQAGQATPTQASGVTIQSTSAAAAPPSAQASAQSAVQTTPAAPAPAPRLPLPNRMNTVLPAWLRVRAEFRERMERFDNLGFIDARDDLYWLSRFRFGATVTPSKALSFQVQVQDARVGDKTVGPTAAPFRAPFDLRMAFADVGSAKGPATVRAGRQELAFGDQRLVGHVSWLNAARTFDGAKLTLRSKTLQIDTFATSVVRIQQDEFDKSGAGNRFAGAYLTAPKLVPQGSLEPYVFYRRDGNLSGEAGALGSLHQTTMGARFAGKMPARLDYNIEMAMQRGSLSSNDVSAWAGHWQLRESLKGAGSVKLTGEFNYASGDASPTDGTRGTFDQLYPTPHDKYGLSDQIGWKNIEHVRAGFEFTPVKALPISANYHAYWLADSHDALYNAGSSVIAPRIAGGAASRFVGQELDVQVSRAIFPQLQVAVGYAHLFTGDFLKESTPGASYSSPYVMATYVFLADKCAQT
jgi:hypothetical protein